MEWRRKKVPASEYDELKENFSTYFRVMRNDPYLAMFSQGEGDDRTVWLTGPNLMMLERHSPGGWETAEGPGKTGAEMVVGRDDFWDYHKVRQQQA
jgi:hypothetical protein